MFKNLLIPFVCSILFSLSSNAQFIPDSTFGQNGYTISSLNYQEDQEVNKLKSLGDNSILALGKDSNRFALWKFTSNGQPDYNFGVNGKAVNPHYLYTNTTTYPTSSKIVDVAIANNGDIYTLLHKTVNNGSADSNNHHIVLLKFKTNGQVDYSFGNNGFIDDRPIQGYEFMPYSIATDKNTNQNGGGTIYIGCLAVEEFHAACALGWGAWSISKYSENGIADSSFNNMGTILETTSFIKQGIPQSPLSVPLSLKVLTNGDIKCAGTSTKYDSIAFTMLFRSDGTLNTSYANNGKQVYYFFSNNNMHIPNKTKILDDGSVIFKSYRNYFNPDSFFTDMVHILPNGTVDMNYGNNGRLTYKVPQLGQGYSIECDKNQFLTYTGASGGNTLGLLPFYCGLFDKNGQFIKHASYTLSNHTSVPLSDPRIVHMWLGDASSTYDNGILTTTTLFDLSGHKRFNIAKHKWAGLSPLSTNDINENNSTQVYPNPLNEQQELKINSSAKLQKIILYNSIGQLIYTKKLNNSKFEIIHLPNLTPGYYFSKIETDKGIKTTKLLVQ